MSNIALLTEYLSKIAIQLLDFISLCLLTVSNSLLYVTLHHCGHCCLLLLTALCNGIRVLCEAKWTHHCFPTDRIAQQQLMMVVKEGKAGHIGHLFHRYWKPSKAASHFLSHHSHSKTCILSCPLSRSHTNNRRTLKLLYMSTQSYLFFPEEWRSAARTGSVLLELFGVLQQVFICQFSGCRCRALLKTSHGISWRCHGLDTTSHTLTRVPVYSCDTKVTWS